MARKRGGRMTIQKALEVIKNEVSYKSGIIINQALNLELRTGFRLE